MSTYLLNIWLTDCRQLLHFFPFLSNFEQYLFRRSIKSSFNLFSSIYQLFLPPKWSLTYVTIQKDWRLGKLLCGYGNGWEVKFWRSVIRSGAECLSNSRSQDDDKKKFDDEKKSYYDKKYTHSLATRLWSVPGPPPLPFFVIFWWFFRRLRTSAELIMLDEGLNIKNSSSLPRVSYLQPKQQLLFQVKY